MKKLLKNGLFYGLRGLFPVCRRFFAGRAVIVMFHEIQRDCRSELTTGTSVELFEYSVSWLQRKGWAIVSLQECLERLARDDQSRRYAVLTFDDGYRDNVSVALPILERNNAPFMMYVPTAALTRTMHSWWLGLRELIRSREAITIDAMGVRFRCPDLRSKQAALGKVHQWVHQDYKRAAALATTFENAGISMSALNDRYFLDARALQSLARHPLASIGGNATACGRPSTRQSAPASACRRVWAAFCPGRSRMSRRPARTRTCLPTGARLSWCCRMSSEPPGTASPHSGGRSAVDVAGILHPLR